MDKHPTRQAPSNPRLILTQDAAQRLKRDGQVAGAVMNHAFSIEQRYSKELEKLTAQMVKEMKAAIVAELQQAVTKAEATLGKTGQDADEPTDKPTAATGTGVMTAIEKVNARFKKMFASLSTGLAKGMVGQVSKTSETNVSASLKELVGRHTVGMGFMNNPQTAAAIKGAIKENAKLISSFPDEYAARLKKTMKTSLLHGGNLGAFKKSVDRIIDRTDKDAGTIRRKVMNTAIDQTRKAYVAMNETRLTAAGVKKFEWIHSGGGATARPFHLHQWPTGLNGGIFEFANPPVIDPDTGERGMPAQLPNCKCTFRPVVEFDESGELSEEQMAGILGEAPRQAPKETPISPPLTPLPRDFYGAGTNRLSPASPAFNPRDYFGRPEPAPRVDTTTPPLRPVGFSRTPPRKPPTIKGGSAPTNVPRVPPKPRKPKVAKPTKVPKPRKPPAIPKPKVQLPPRAVPPVKPRPPAKPPVKPIDEKARLEALAAANAEAKRKLAEQQAKNAALAKQLEEERRKLAELEAQKAKVQTYENYKPRGTVAKMEEDLSAVGVSKNVVLNTALPKDDLNAMTREMIGLKERFETPELTSFGDAGRALRNGNPYRYKETPADTAAAIIQANGLDRMLSGKTVGAFVQSRDRATGERFTLLKTGATFNNKIRSNGFGGEDKNYNLRTMKSIRLPVAAPKEVIDAAEASSGFVSYTVSSSARGTIIHEYGHSWHLNKTGAERDEIDRIAKKSVKEGWADLISTYATEDLDGEEYVAEAFTLYNMDETGKEHGRINPELLAIFKKNDRRVKP